MRSTTQDSPTMSGRVSVTGLAMMTRERSTMELMAPLDINLAAKSRASAIVLILDHHGDLPEAAEEPAAVEVGMATATAEVEADQKAVVVEKRVPSRHASVF